MAHPGRVSAHRRLVDESCGDMLTPGDDVAHHIDTRSQVEKRKIHSLVCFMRG